MGIRISAEREITDFRTSLALNQPARRAACVSRPDVDPLDPRIESPLGRLRIDGRITQAEYNAGCQWRNIYFNWLRSIGAPAPFAAAIDYRKSDMIQDDRNSDEDFSDEQAETIAKAFKVGEKTLKMLGPRVFHAVNAIVVYEEPEELGDFDLLARQAQLGLSALARLFG